MAITTLSKRIKCWNNF